MSASRVFSILKLLASNNRVTLQDIVDKCKVSKRTAYRYIHKLSSSGLSISLNQTDTGAVLVKNGLGIISKLSTNDVVYLIIALKLLSKFTNTHYAKEVNVIIDRLALESGLQLFEDINIEHFNSPQELSSDQLTKFLTENLLKTAAIQNASVKAISVESVKQNSFLKLGKISLAYDNEWNVKPKGSPKYKPIPMSDIVYAKMLMG